MRESGYNPIKVPGKIVDPTEIDAIYTQDELDSFNTEAELDQIRDLGEVDIISGSLAVSRTIGGLRLAEEFNDRFYALPEDLPVEGFSDTFYPETARKIFGLLPDQELIL